MFIQNKNTKRSFLKICSIFGLIMSSMAPSNPSSETSSNTHRKRPTSTLTSLPSSAIHQSILGQLELTSHNPESTSLNLSENTLIATYHPSCLKLEELTKAKSLSTHEILTFISFTKLLNHILNDQAPQNNPYTEILDHGIIINPGILKSSLERDIKFRKTPEELEIIKQFNEMTIYISNDELQKIKEYLKANKSETFQISRTQIVPSSSSTPSPLDTKDPNQTSTPQSKPKWVRVSKKPL